MNRFPPKCTHFFGRKILFTIFAEKEVMVSDFTSFVRRTTVWILISVLYIVVGQLKSTYMEGLGSATIKQGSLSQARRGRGTPSNRSNKMSLVVRKPVFGVSDQVPHKPGCTTTQDG